MSSDALFLVFSGASYYPEQGFYDCRGSYTSLEAAKDFLLANNDYDWAHIVDVRTMKVVWEKKNRY